jgi:Family of unknown function (DUF6228)
MPLDVFTIKSSRDDCAIEFFDRDSSPGYYFNVKITRYDLFAAAKVWSGHGDPTPDNWLQGLAQHWQGWDGERQWSSLEGEFSLTATNDCRGHIAITIQLRSGLYDAWFVRVVVFVDAGQLDGLASQAARFFRNEGS